MHLVSVIPVTSAHTGGPLSYYSTEGLARGDLVSVTLRKKHVPALVLALSDVRKQKGTLRGARFSLKKITAVRARRFVTDAFLSAAETLAQTDLQPLGALLAELLPQAVLEKPPKVQTPKRARSTRQHEVIVLQDTDAERRDRFKTIIRESFAQNDSVLLVVPSRADAELLFRELTRGIEQYAYLLHGTITKKQQRDKWTALAEETHPVLVVASTTFLSVPRDDLGTVIVEREGSRAYKSERRPFVDTRKAARALAAAANARLLLADTLLRIETLYAYNEQMVAALAPPKMRYHGVETHVTDMRKETPENKGSFAILGAILKRLITQTLAEKTPLFLFAVRRGIAGVTVCSDCGYTLTCTRCHAPLVLHKRKNSARPTHFICHQCGERTPSETRCAHCTSWRLTALGVGAERVAAAVQAFAPEATLFEIHRDAVRTHAGARTTAETWRKSKGGILVGTEMALPYVTEHLRYTGIVSLDTFFALPDFRMEEKIFRLIISLRLATKEGLVIQTRIPDAPVITHALAGNVASLYRDEIVIREKLSLPPFTELLALRLERSAQKLPGELQKLEERFAPWKPAVTPLRRRGRKTTAMLLITIPANTPLEKPLREALAELPPSVSIDTAPDAVL